MHGGASPGGPKGKANGRYVHGMLTGEAIARRRQFRALMKAARETMEIVR